MTELALPSPALPVPAPTASAAVGGVIPAIVAGAGDRAAQRFLEFFAATLCNPNTRAAYARAAARFFAWCERHGLAELAAIEPLHVAAYVEALGRGFEKPTVKQHLAAIRALFDWLAAGDLLAANPAARRWCNDAGGRGERDARLLRRRTSGASSNADRDGLCRADHPVEHLDPDCDLSSLIHHCSGTQFYADRGLVAADTGLDQIAPAIVRPLLPSHAAPLADQLDVVIAPRRIGGGRLARRRCRPRWDHDIRWRVGLTRRHHLVAGFTIIRAVGGDAGDLALDLLEQDRQLAGIVGLLVGQGVSDDLAGLGVEGDVQFPPGARRSAVLLLLPFAATEQLQSGAVDHEVQRAVGHDMGSWAGQAAAAAAQGSVVGDGEIEPEKPQQAADEPLRLS